MRQLAHFVLVTLGFLVWCAAMWAMAATTVFALLAEKVKPNSLQGNCWSYVLPNWWRHGGYMLVRAADGVKFLGFFPIPHVIWIRSLAEGSDLEHFKPVARKSAIWMPWHTVYYKGIVSTNEHDHHAKDST